MTESTATRTFVTRRQCYLFATAAVITHLLVTMGGIVCVTGSGRACPDWPGCFGRVIPPMRLDAIIEYTHRLLAALAAPFIFAAAIVGRWKFNSIRWVSRPPAIAVALVLLVIVFGALAVLRGLRPIMAAIDLGSALIVLALMLTASVVAFSRGRNSALPDRLSFRNPFARLALATLGAVFAVLVSGVLVAESGSIVRCLGWPLFNEPLFYPNFQDGLQVGRGLTASATGFLIIAVVVQAWRTQRNDRMILNIATAVGFLFLTETIIGVVMQAVGFVTPMLVIYVSAAAALWAVLVILVVLVGVKSAVLTVS